MPLKRPFTRGISRAVVPRGGGGGVAAIYGVSWDKGSSPALTRTDDAVGMVANAGVDGSTPQNDFDSAEIYSAITEVVDGFGNVFIRIPRFYIEKTDGVGFKTWRISRNPFGSAYLPSCFWDFNTSTPLPYVDVGKHVATRAGDGKLESKPNLYPVINRTIVQMRTDAQANGAGYQQLDIHVMDMLQTLFYVEFATLNSQSVMQGFTVGQYNEAHVALLTESGVNRIVVTNAQAALYRVGQTISIGTSLGGNQIFYGRTITAINDIGGGNSEIVFDGASVNIATGNIVYNTAWKNGFAGSIAASSGSLSSNSNGLYPMKYRGIENLWGNMWQFCDGVNINERQAWVARDADDYASNLFAAPYEQLSYINHNADGYQISTGFDADHPFAAFPTTVGGSASTYYSDYYYQTTGQRIALVGSFWTFGAVAGLALWNLVNLSSVASLSTGGRMVRKAA